MELTQITEDEQKEIKIDDILIQDSKHYLRNQNNIINNDIMNKYFEQGIMHISYKKAIKLFGCEATNNSLMNEAKTMLQKNVWTPVIWNDIAEEDKKFNTLNSFTFYKDKWYPDQTFEKLKARSVVNGSEQRIEENEILFSPTPATSSAFTICAIAAVERRKIEKLMCLLLF